LNDSFVVLLIGFVALFFIPDGLNLGAYKFMMPYFIISFYFHRYIEDKGGDKIEKYKYYMLISLVLAFVGLFQLYDEESFIYLTGYKLIGKNVPHQLYIDFYRMMVGFVGSGVFILLWKCITDISGYEFKILRWLGVNSLGIYILSGYIIVFVVQRLDFIEKYSYIINVAEAIVVLIVAALLVEIMGRIPYVRKFVGK
jgi:surface polysaccharide O-acyltransferase-like enzyme